MISQQGDNLVFLLGIPRSGTTLLSVILNQQPALRCPPEPWLMLALESLGRTSARSAADAPVLYRAINQFCDRATLTAGARKLAVSVYNQSLTAAGKNILIDKTPRYYLILPYLKEVFPKAKYILLWRNPLDIAASMKTTWQVDVPGHLAARQDHLTCIDLVVGLRQLFDFEKANKDRVHSLQYEQLVRDPLKTANGLLEWLGQPAITSIKDFQLAGTEFDHREMGDKKVLSTTAPHQKSIGRWSSVFKPEEVRALLQSIGPHFISAIGYRDVLKEVEKLDVRVEDSAQANDYAQRLTASLAARNTEYESATTYSDLTIQERRLHQATFGSASAPERPLQIDLASELRAYAEAATSHLTKLAAANTEANELRLANTSIYARLEEIRELFRLQGEHSGSRETNWTERVIANERALATHEFRVADLTQRLSGAEESQRAAHADLAVQNERNVRLVQELAASAARLQVLENDLSAEHSRVAELTAQAESAKAEISAGQTRVAELTAQVELARGEVSAGQVQIAELSAQIELARAEISAAQIRSSELSTQMELARADLSVSQAHVTELTAQAELARNELSAEQARAVELTAQVAEARDQSRLIRDDLSAQLDKAGAELQRLRIDALQTGRPPARNRRPWPYAPVESTSLPATLPGGKPWPKISIVTPTFNQGKYIEQTILSVINQNYPNLEYIIMDGASTDETLSIIERYRDRITFFASEKDRGQSHAINKGMARATGELLTWLNSDDLLEPGALAAMAMAFHTSGADMVAGVCSLHSDGKILGRHLTSCVDGPLPLDELLDIQRCWQRGQFFYQPEVMFTRDLFDRAGGHVDEQLFFSMDYELWLRFAEQGARIHPIGRPIALFRVHDEQKTRADFVPELTGVVERFAQRTGKVPHNNGEVPVSKTHLRVLFFNDIGPVGGAGIAHQRLAIAMAAAGHEIIPLGITPNLTTCQMSNDALIAAFAERSPDLVILGNIHAANIDPTFIGALASRWPTVQVLHDFFTLTGRCPYTGDCTKFLSGCDHTCPTVHEYPLREPSLIRGEWEKKLTAMTSEPAPILAAISNWTEQFARRRFADAPPEARGNGNTPKIINIRHGLAVDVFKPRDKAMCRDMLDLPQDRFIVLFSSSHLSDQRKGIDHLFAALESLKLPDLLATCIGHFDIAGKAAPFEIRNMGYVSDNHSLAMLYSAADIFVGPSRVETFGQVYVEAAACGTPSIGYATAGGVAESIADGISGCLAPVQDPAELARVIALLHDDPKLRQDLGAWGRLWVENEFSYRSSYQRMFAQLNRIGVMAQLNIAPKVGFFHDHVATPGITYLEPPPQPAPAPAAPSNGNGAYSQLESRLASMEAERDSLRTAMNAIVQTRLWRMVAATYPKYQKVLGSTRIPRLVKRPVHAMGQWLAKRKSS